MSSIKNTYYPELKIFLSAFILACGLWYLVVGSSQVEGQVEMRVDYHFLPERMVVLGGLEKKIVVRVRASEELLRRLQGRDLVYTVNLSDVARGANVFPVDMSRNRDFKPFEILKVYPQSLVLEVDRLMRNIVPVEVRFSGQLPQDLSMDNFVVKPTELEVRGPRSVLSKLEKVYVNCDLTQVTNSGKFERNFSIELPENVHVDSPVANLIFDVKAHLVLAKVMRYIQINNKYFKGEISPKKVELELEIPASKVINGVPDATFMSQIRAIVSLPDKVIVGQKFPLEIILPQRVELVTVDPIEVIIKE